MFEFASFDNYFMSNRLAFMNYSYISLQIRAETCKVSCGLIRKFREEKTAHKLTKRMRKQHKDTFTALVFKLDFECLFEGFRRQMYQKCSNNCCKNDALLEATSKMDNCVSTAPARADRGSDPPEKQTKAKKNDLRTNTPTRPIFLWKVAQKDNLFLCENLTSGSHPQPSLPKPLYLKANACQLQLQSL